MEKINQNNLELMTLMERKNCNSIDLMKFVMSLCVVTIHTFVMDALEPSWGKDLLHALVRSAVPFFFMTSAYFVVGNWSSSREKQYCKRILWLYVVWTIVNYCLCCLLRGSFSWDSFGKAVYSFVFNGYSVLWYLWGLLLVMPLVGRIKNWGGKSFLLLVAIGAYLLNRVFTHYGSLEGYGVLSWLYDGNYFGVTNFCLAMTYLSLGAFYATSDFTLKRWQNVSLILLGIAMMHFDAHKDVALGVPIIAFGLFPLVREWSMSWKGLDYMYLRKMSTLIYVSHVIVITAVGLVMGKMSLMQWGVVEVCCISLSAILLWLQRFRCFHFISKII